jgi:hypothetical protein
MIIKPAKSKAVCFTRAQVTELLNYSLRDIVILEESNCKYLGIILRSNLSWADQVNYTVLKTLPLSVSRLSNVGASTSRNPMGLHGL